MKKKVKLIMVPSKPEKLELGMFLQKIRNGILINEFATANESSLECQNKMGFEWRAVQSYLVSDDDIDVDELCLFSVKGDLIEAYPDDLLGPDIDWVKKVIASPEQIGQVSINTSGYDFLGAPCVGSIEENLTIEHIKTIIKNDGNCEIKTKLDKNNKVTILL